MEFLNQPAEMVMEGDLGANWKKFKNNLDLYMKATGCVNKTEDTKCAVLLHCIGEQGRDIFNTFEIGEENTLAAYIKKFDTYFLPKVNSSVERNKFNTRIQNQEETFDNFVKDLRKLANNCDFGTFKEELIKDRIVCGVRDKRVKERLLREPDLKLDKAIDIGRAAEAAELHIKNLHNSQGQRQGESDAQVGVIRKKKMDKNHNMRWQQSQSQAGRQRHSNSWKKQEGRPQERERRGEQWGRQEATGEGSCERCNFVHARNKCPAYGKKCSICGRFGHFMRCCRYTRRVNNVNVNENDVDRNVNDSENDAYTLGTINANDRNDWYIELELVGLENKIKLKLDTGAQINVLPSRLLRKWNKTVSNLKYTDIKVTNYGGSRLQVKGTCLLKLLFKGKIEMVEFVVVETNDDCSVPILGISTIKKLELLKCNFQVRKEEETLSDILNKHENVFKGLGNISCEPCDFVLRENYKAVVSPSRKIPFGIRDKLKVTLDKMVEDKVITKVKEPTEFVHPIVLVNKPNNEIRVCLDPQNLNRELRREIYRLPTFEELTCEIAGSKIFSTLDANKGFYQIKLTERASLLTTFITPFGRYRFLRLPFGISVAPEIFHRVFTEIFSDIKNVKIYIDDLIIYARDEKEHDEILKQVLVRAEQKGVKFNKSKCKFGVREVKYVGHILSEEGIKVDGEKVEAIRQMRNPQDTKEVQRFLGMVTYVNKFIPNLNDKTVHLRKLIKKGVAFEWKDEQQAEFDNLKKLLVSTPVLQYYDSTKELVLSVDSSKDGLGAVLLQEGGPIAYASKALTEAQKKYAQIEKETLAITFGCQKFYQYLYGKHFTVESDHRALEIIFKKPLDMCPLRIQRLRITLQQYDFTVKFKNGAKLYLADALSRSFHDDENFKIVENNLELQLNFINYVSISPQQFDRLRQETVKDKELIELKKVIMEGWPDSKTKLSDVIRPYFKIRAELTVAKDVIFKNNQIVIPKTMRNEILDRLHYNHMGIEKTYLRAKEHVYWPFMRKQISDKVSNCEACIKYTKSLQKETLIEKERASRP